MVKVASRTPRTSNLPLDQSAVEAQLDNTKQTTQPNKPTEEPQSQLRDSLGAIFAAPQSISYAAPLEDSSAPYSNSIRHPSIDLFPSTEHIPMTQAEFEIHVNRMAKTKLFSTILVDRKGRFLYANKLGNEHFEGSLNNLKRIHLIDLVLASKRNNFYKQAQGITGRPPYQFKFVMYSKNTKRRFCLTGSDCNQSTKDIYFRYLKSISARVWPVQISLTNRKQIPGFWNKQLTEDNQQMECFMLNCRLSGQDATVDEGDFTNDPLLGKFFTSVAKRRSNPQSKLLTNRINSLKIRRAPIVHLQRTFNEDDFLYFGYHNASGNQSCGQEKPPVSVSRETTVTGVITPSRNLAEF